VRHPISPLARIWSAHIRNSAAANSVLIDAENDWRRVDFEDVYATKDLQMMMNSYAEIPAGIRPLLLGRVMHCAMTQAAIWTKREEMTTRRRLALLFPFVYELLPPVKALRATVSSVFRLLILLVEAVGQIEVRICPSKGALFWGPVFQFPVLLASHATSTDLDPYRTPKDHGGLDRAGLARQA
jgi:hypothetical protein